MSGVLILGFVFIWGFLSGYAVGCVAMSLLFGDSSFGNLILNWPKLLRPFKTVFPPYMDVYVFTM